MRSSQYLIPTSREVPADAEIPSHQLMLRAGMIRKSAAGLYSWLPLGLRVLRKVEAIIRQEMESAGAQELLMPVVQAAELWQESGRWEQYGPELLRIKDRHDRAFCLGPTHEEVITDIVRNEIQSYKQLPLNLYQIQTKFRDEIRPRFGVMRAREFTMKDAYSFHSSDDCLENTYQRMHQAYTAIFSRLGMEFRAVIADSGSIGGSTSHEFHVLADSGEDAIALSNSSDFAANVELAESVLPSEATHSSKDSNSLDSSPLKKVPTGNATSIEEVCAELNLTADQTVKTLIVKGQSEDEAQESHWVALVLRGDHSLNEIKAEKLSHVACPLQFASEEDIVAVLGCKPGSIGPVDIDRNRITVVVDRYAAAMETFCCGANENEHHLLNTEWSRDVTEFEIADLRNVEEGDPSPDGKGTIIIKRGIEVGHIFQLGKKYSGALQATVLNEQGKPETITMGCYGIGVSRIVAACIEQNHDDKGVRWPAAMAPFEVILVPLNAQKSELVRETSESLYRELKDHGFDVLIDDRNERPGVKFKDAELIGIPHVVVLGEKSLKNGCVEYKSRDGLEEKEVTPAAIVELLSSKLGAHKS